MKKQNEEEKNVTQIAITIFATIELILAKVLKNNKTTTKRATGA